MNEKSSTSTLPRAFTEDHGEGFLENRCNKTNLPLVYLAMSLNSVLCFGCTFQDCRDFVITVPSPRHSGFGRISR